MWLSLSTLSTPVHLALNYRLSMNYWSFDNNKLTLVVHTNGTHCKLILLWSYTTQNDFTSSFFLWNTIVLGWLAAFGNNFETLTQFQMDMFFSLVQESRMMSNTYFGYVQSLITILDCYVLKKRCPFINSKKLAWRCYSQVINGGNNHLGG